MRGGTQVLGRAGEREEAQGLSVTWASVNQRVGQFPSRRVWLPDEDSNPNGLGWGDDAVLE